MSGRSTHAGFSLLELMMTVAILSVIAAFAVPSFQTLIMLSRLSSEANELVAALGQARSEAIRMNRRTVLCRATLSGGQVSTADGCSAGDGAWQGWMVFIDADSNGAFNPDTGTNPDEVVVRTHVFNGDRLDVRADNTLSAAGNRIVFRPDGLARAAGQTLLQTASLRICEPSDSATQNARDVRLAGGSRVSVTRTTSAACSAPEAD